MRMNKENSPVGSVVLCRKSGVLFEHEVLAWSDGGRLKVRAPHSADRYEWLEDNRIPEFVEMLTPPKSVTESGFFISEI